MRLSSKLLILCLAALMSANPVAAQNNRARQSMSSNESQYTISGKVIDAENGTPLEMVNITFENNSFWAVTDMKGVFSLKLKDGSYKYSVSYLGYETATGTLKVNGKNISDFNIKMQATSLALSEVVVTAKQQAMGSSSVIDQTALQHLQPKSVEDILQLTPGNLTKNPSINSIGQAQLREISGSASNAGSKNNAMGASIIVDGAPVANDAAMQVMSTAKNGTSVDNQNSTGRGADLRTISTDNIENIEVIRGIPSVEYGNLTSGAVIIKTKKGSTPLEVKGKVDPFSKMAYIGKGFTLSSGGTVNMAADYSESYDDIRFRAKGFERITGDISYSRSFFLDYPLSFTAKASYYQNINSERIDKQQRNNEQIVNDNRGIRLNINGDWNIKRLLVSNLSYNVSLNYSKQEDYQKEDVILSTGITPIATSSTPGESLGVILNGTYNAEHTMSGRPLGIFTQIKGNRLFIIKEGFTTSIKEGVEFKYDVNHGDGLKFDPNRPPFVRNVQTVRPRPYYDVPAMKTWSSFIENKTLAPIGSTSLTAQVGVRTNYLIIDRNYLDRSNMFNLEPRFNMEWELLNDKNNSLFDKMSISGGWGLTSKLPPLVYLYPDKSYFDEKSFSYINANPEKNIAVMTTAIITDTSNPELKPSTGKKMEIGLNFDIKSISGNVTFFKEHYENEFTYNSIPYTFAYRTFNPPAGGTNYRYENGNLYYEKDNVTYSSAFHADSSFQSYGVPTNGCTTDKMGIEYTLNLGQIKALRTSVVVDGAWLWVKRRSAVAQWSSILTVDPVVDEKTNRQKAYPYQAYYPAGEGSLESRTNTNFRFITHIPSLSLIFSTTAQIVWNEYSQRIWQDDNGNDLWYMGVDNLSTSKDMKPCVDPLAYRDFAGNIYTWNPEYRNISLHRREYDMIQISSYSTSYNKSVMPAYMIFNFRLTKQFGDRLEFSFMANNLFNTRKMYQSSTSGVYYVITPDQYFGAELKLSL